MSSISTSPTTDTQQWIDLRLDAVDRALLGLLPRGERMELVAKVESRLRELAPAVVAAEANGTPAPGDASIDSALASPAPRSGSAAAWTTLRRRRPRSRLAVASGVLGIVALALLVMLPIVYLFLGMLDSDESILIAVLGTHLSSLALGGLLSVVLGVVALVVINRRDGQLVGHGWAITGLCTAPMPMLIGGLAMLVLGSELLGSQVVTVEATTSTVPPPTLSYPVPVEAAQGMPVAAPAPPCVAPQGYSPYAACPATGTAPGMPVDAPAPAGYCPSVASGQVAAVPSSYNAPSPEASPGPVAAEVPTAKDVESGPVPEFARIPTASSIETEAGAAPAPPEPMPEPPPGAYPSANAPSASAP
ncbi:MAG TPA: hypothetical protein VHC22_15445 [Pirellulales bacterium]|nr:hypothetical protein [Pirellulales bacterium]